jgi:hypothetical protein
MVLKGKQLAELYFVRKSAGEDTWICKCGTERLQKGTGYSNLCSHIITDHPEYSKLGEDMIQNKHSIMDYIWPKRVRNVYGWLRWITMDFRIVKIVRLVNLQNLIQYQSIQL